jgi:hypothetical protein
MGYLIKILIDIKKTAKFPCYFFSFVLVDLIKQVYLARFGLWRSFAKNRKKCKALVFGTDLDRNRALEETPRS